MKSLFFLLSLILITSCAKSVKVADFEFEGIEEKERKGVSYSQVASVMKTASNTQVKKLITELKNKADFLYIANDDNYKGFDEISTTSLVAQYIQNPHFEKETFDIIVAATKTTYISSHDALALALEYDYELNKNYHIKELDRYSNRVVVSCTTLIFNINCKGVKKAQYPNIKENLLKVKDSPVIAEVYSAMVDGSINYNPEYTKRTQILKDLFLNFLSKEQQKSIHFYSLFKEDYAKIDIDWKLLEKYSEKNIHNQMMFWSISRNILMEEHFSRRTDSYAIRNENLIKMFKLYAKTEKIPAIYLFKTLRLEEIDQFKKQIDQGSLLGMLTSSYVIKVQYEFIMKNLVINYHQKDSENNSYLHVAAQFGDHKRIAMLKDMGLKNEFNKDNNTPFDIAIKNGYYSLAKKIDEREFSSIAAFLAKK